MALYNSFGPPSYEQSLSCEVLKSKRVTVATRLSLAEDGATPDFQLDFRFSPPTFGGNAAPSFSGSICDEHSGGPVFGPFRDGQDAAARVSAATEENAPDFIWSELSKELKAQWDPRSLRAVLDECPRYAPPTGGDRFVRLYVDITSGAFSRTDWQLESEEMMQFIIGGVPHVDPAAPAFGVVDGDQGARDRISTATEDNAIHFIWTELPKELKTEWDWPLIRSVLDACPKYSSEAAGNRFVRLYDDILSGALSASLWREQRDAMLASLQDEHDLLIADHALAQQLQSLGGDGAALAFPFMDDEDAAAFAFGRGRRCKARGCTEDHERHRCRNCKAYDSDHRTADCPNPRAAGGPPAVVAVAVPVDGGGAVAVSASPVAASGLVLFGPPNEKTLFHQTSPASGQKIVQEQLFLCSDTKGRPLLAGPGIYFAASAVDTHHKVRNPANKGCILEATVSLGKVLDLTFDGDKSITLQTLRAQGFDSVSVPRNGNPGTEYVVYDTRQISNIRVHQPQ